MYTESEVLYSIYQLLGDGEGNGWFTNEQTDAYLSVVGNMLPLPTDLPALSESEYRMFMLGYVWGSQSQNVV
jgi:hypothetical protein